MTSKNWKDFLLSSGLPLEHCVAQILKKAGVLGGGEFIYQRRNELNILTQFSVDIYSSYILGDRLWIDFLIECKYRHDSAKWVFTPNEYKTFFGPEFNHAFLVLDDLADDYKIDTESIDKFSKLYKLCSKGTELLSNNCNPKSIENAISQLKYAVPHRITDAMIHQIDKELGKISPIFITIPIIVTTAELWRIRPEITMDDVRAADDLRQVAEQEEVLIIHQQPDNELRQYSHKLFTDSFDRDQQERISKIMKTREKHSFRFFADVYSTYFPSMFVVVQFGRFEKAIHNVIKFFSQSKHFKRRGNDR